MPYRVLWCPLIFVGAVGNLGLTWITMVIRDYFASEGGDGSAPAVGEESWKG